MVIIQSVEDNLILRETFCRRDSRTKLKLKAKNFKIKIFIRVKTVALNWANKRYLPNRSFFFALGFVTANEKEFFDLFSQIFSLPKLNRSKESLPREDIRKIPRNLHFSMKKISSTLLSGVWYIAAVILDKHRRVQFVQLCDIPCAKQGRAEFR